MARLWHTTNIYLHPQIHQYTERLLATLPSQLQVTAGVNRSSDLDKHCSCRTVRLAR